ncbi:hypothetical protein BG011_007755 [Mortierella polycephala]|uniref:Uncharacterized protein n=1 Tax=Mortierella polycephala TaxID=41804 RepID=A0A9P6PRW2_9FUNG|nr:hypothetical protein BG011_007755 [Mortierella polycephala]
MTLTTPFAEMVETGSEDEDEDEDMDQQMWLVYEKLSRLIQLKCLDIGYVSLSCNYLQLRLQLSEGLGQL